MIHLWDGNNVMRRAMDKGMPQARPMTLRMRYEQTYKDQHIWVWDGYQHNERRRDIYPPYKTKRKPTPEDIFSQINLFRDVLKHSPATQITVHGWEADDVIGTLVRKAPGRFIVHTNDMDYGQIEHLCKLDGCNLKGVPARWIPLYKAMNGDSSDNIDGIPGFGPKRWLEMEPHWAQIERAILAGDPAGFVGLPFKPAVAVWLTDPVNVALLQAMLTVTHFQNVPDDELNGGITMGVPNHQKAHAMLSEFFL
jgi:hypothetical protein